MLSRKWTDDFHRVRPSFGIARSSARGVALIRARKWQGAAAAAELSIMAPRYERVPTADDDSPSSPTAEKSSLTPRSRRGKLILLSLVVVVLLSVVYRFWFRHPDEDASHGTLPADDSKQDDTVGDGKRPQEPTKPNMPNGKLSVG